MLNNCVAEVGVRLSAVVEAALLDQADIRQLGHDVWVLGAKTLNKGSGAALSHCVVDSSIENIVHDNVGTDTMMALATWPAETVDKVNRHLELCCALSVVFLYCRHQRYDALVTWTFARGILVTLVIM